MLKKIKAILIYECFVQPVQKDKLWAYFYQCSGPDQYQNLANLYFKRFNLLLIAYIYHKKSFKSLAAALLWTLKGTVSRDFLLLVFFMNQFPRPQSITIGTFHMFLKNHGDFRKSRCTTRRLLIPVLTPVANLPPVSMTLVAICHW
jgi:hypothetical protein